VNFSAKAIGRAWGTVTRHVPTIAILFIAPIATFLAPLFAVVSRRQHERLWWLYVVCAPLIAFLWWSTLRGDRELARHRGYIDGLTRAVDLQREKRVRP
jgi:hypothetical protein